MSEGYVINFGKFEIGYSKSTIHYGKIKIKDGNIYQFYRFYIWVKE